MDIEELCAKIESGDFLGAPQANKDSSAIFSFSDQIQKLGLGLEQISSELKSQVREHHGALLSQASHAGRLEGSLSSVDGQMKKLVGHANEIAQQVDAPFAVLEQQTAILTRIHDASYLMRQAGKFLELYRQLKAVKSDFAKQATIFHELDVLIEEDPSLAGINCIKDEIVAVQAARKKIINLADKELMQGLVRREKRDVLSAVHILYNLGILESFFGDRLATFVLDVKQAVKECFTAPETKIGSQEGRKEADKGQRRGPGKTPTLTTNLNFRNKLWLALEWLFNEEIFDYAQQIEFLCACLREDAAAFVVTSQQFDLKTMWWQKLGALLKEAFGTAPAHILQCLQEGLPQLTSITRNFVQKLGLEYGAVFSSSMYHSLHPGFVEKCAATLKASLNNGVDLPTEEHLDQFMRLSATALNSAMVDNQLLELVASVVISCNKELTNRLEAHVKLGTDSTQIYDVPNGGQLQNIVICNLIHHHGQNWWRFVADNGSSGRQQKQQQKEEKARPAGSVAAFENILGSLEGASKLAMTVVQQLMDAVKASLGDIFMSMHREPGLNTSQSTTPSLYMKELQDFIQRVWTAHMRPFTDEEMRLSCGKELAGRCIELFIRNAAILRPLTAIGRNKLRVDCQFVEVAVRPLVGSGGVASLGRVYRTLRAFQNVVVMGVEELAEQNLDAETQVPAYIILLLLFGHAGNDLLSPHITAGWTNEKLIKWLDGHTADRDRFELVSGALLKYRNDIRKKNLSQYDPVYPVISNCLEKAYQAKRGL